jgi:hypothetical protein
VLDGCQVPESSVWLKERGLMSSLIKQNLIRAQNRMKQQADKKRFEVTF